MSNGLSNCNSTMTLFGFHSKYEISYCCVGVKLVFIANNGEFAHHTKHILNAK